MLLSLHNGAVRMGLESPTAGFLSYIRRSLAFWQESEGGAPDLRIRHVEKLVLPEPPLYLGDASGLAGTTFFICDHDGSRAVLPLGADGIPEIVAEHGFRPATLYVLAVEPFIQLALLNRGYSFVHSSAFELDGHRILLAAGGHVGKTAFLLRALSVGARYLADDWSVLSDTGDLLSYPRPLRIFEYNTDDLPAIRSRLSVFRRGLHLGISRLRHGYQRLRPSNSFVHRMAGKVVDLAVEVSQVHVPAEALFPASAARARGPLSVACFMTSWEGGSLEVEPARPEQIAGRLTASYGHEHIRLFEHQHQYAAATGDGRDLRTDTLSRMTEVTTAALSTVSCCLARIPASMPRDEAFPLLRRRLVESARSARLLQG